MSRCKICNSPYCEDVNLFGRNSVNIYKIQKWLLEKKQVQISISALRNHFSAHTEIPTKGMFIREKSKEMNESEDAGPVLYAKEPELTDAEKHRRKIVREKKLFYGETDAEINAAFAEEDQAAKKLKETQETIARAMEKGHKKRREMYAYQEWKRDHQDEIKGLYTAFEEKENGKKEN